MVDRRNIYIETIFIAWKLLVKLADWDTAGVIFSTGRFHIPAIHMKIVW